MDVAVLGSGAAGLTAALAAAARGAKIQLLEATERIGARRNPPQRSVVTYWSHMTRPLSAVRLRGGDEPRDVPAGNRDVPVQVGGAGRSGSLLRRVSAFVLEGPSVKTPSAPSTGTTARRSMRATISGREARQHCKLTLHAHQDALVGLQSLV